MGMVASRYEVYHVNLNPTISSEIKKHVPVSSFPPDEMNYPAALRRGSSFAF